MYILLSFWTVILFSVPFWWISTSIERLPLKSLSSNARQSLESLRFSETVILSVEGSGGELDEDRLVEEVRRELELLGRGKGGDEILVSTRSAWDLLYNSTSSPSSSSPWEVVVQLSTTPLHPLTHLPLASDAILGSVGDSSIYVQASPETLPNLPRYLSQTLSHLLPTSEHLLSAQDPKVAKFSDHYTLAFTLLLEDVTEGENPLHWEIEKSLEATIQPLLDALSPLHTFTLESQIQYHSPLSVTPVQRSSISPSTDSDELSQESAASPSTWIVEREDTKAFVNSEQWSLGSQGVVDDGPTLQFMLFVPRGERRPLKFEAEGVDKTSTSFLIPQQGSLVIYNPPSSTASSSSSSSTLTSHLLHPPLTSHLQHLRRLLGIPSSTSILPGNTIFASQSSLGHPSSKITKWELSWLARARTLQNVKDSVGGVMGLERLVGKIGEMRVGKKVRDDVLGAVGELEEIVKSSPSSPFEIFPRSSRALALSSRAFFNPTMLGLLYFPDEHKYAVYTPLFAPVGVPLVVALVKAIKKRRKDRAEAAKSKEKVVVLVDEKEDASKDDPI